MTDKGMVKGKCACGKEATAEFLTLVGEVYVPDKWCDDCKSKYKNEILIPITMKANFKTPAMTEQEILNEAIIKAKRNGWKTTVITRKIGHEYQVIFSHDFAKAFFGESVHHYEEDGGAFPNYPAWRHHLKQMVSKANPVDYLRKFIQS